jgi:hypothetical protein
MPTRMKRSRTRTQEWAGELAVVRPNPETDQ